MAFMGLSKTDAYRCVRENDLRSNDAKLHGNNSCVVGSGCSVLKDRLTSSGKLIRVLYVGQIANLEISAEPHFPVQKTFSTLT